MNDVVLKKNPLFSICVTEILVMNTEKPLQTRHSQYLNGIHEIGIAADGQHSKEIIKEIVGLFLLSTIWQRGFKLHLKPAYNY